MQMSANRVHRSLQKYFHEATLNYLKKLFCTALQCILKTHRKGELIQISSRLKAIMISAY